jgi:hypothetical protein
MDPRLIEKLFADLDVPVDGPSRLERAKALVSHALGGCRPVPLLRFDPASERVVEVGLICATCLRNCDYTDEPIQ